MTCGKRDRMSDQLVLIEENYENLLQLLQRFAQYGPFAGIGLTMIESLFPPLPLVVFVTVNVIAYGFVRGYLYSFLGTFIGSYIMFLVFSKFGRSRFEHMVHRSKRLDNLLHWIKEQGFMPIFILLTFPFTPSIVVCGLAGLAGVKRDEYVVALFLGKLIMVLSLSFIGFNLSAFVQQPIKSLLFILATLSFSFIGKQLIAIYEKTIERRKRHKMEHHQG